jgi:hypothetical protein
VQSSRPSIAFRITSIAHHGTGEVALVSLYDYDNDQWASLEARKYDLTRAGMKEGDMVRLTMVPEFEDSLPHDMEVVKIRAKVQFYNTAIGTAFQEPPDSKMTLMFLATWFPWVANTKFQLQSKTARELGHKAGDIVKIIITKEPKAQT